MNTSSPMDRLQALDSVENEILQCIQCAGQALQELSKDSKPSGKAADHNTTQFIKTLNRVELEIGKHINYLTQVSTGHSHEGSSYASQKVVQMAWHRSEHAKSRVLDLDRMKTQMQALATVHQRQGSAAGQTPQRTPGTSQPPGQTVTNPPPSSAGSTPVHTPMTDS